MIETVILHYCQYQERCHSEVRNKLYELGCDGQYVEQYLSKLIECGVLNEERFAKAYARGKFRMKQWGRVKIRQQLRQRKVSEYCIKQGLLEIDHEDYEQTLYGLACKRGVELDDERNITARKAKLYRYLAQKGYESDLIAGAVNKVLKK